MDYIIKPVYNKEQLYMYKCYVTYNRDNIYSKLKGDYDILFGKYNSIKYFPARLVHDLRNDLNIIQGSIECVDNFPEKHLINNIKNIMNQYLI